MKLIPILFLASCLSASAQLLPYKNPSLPVAERVEDLLSRMTLTEKVGQLQCLLGWESYVTDGATAVASDQFKREINERHVGMYWATFRADPWTRKTLANGLNPKTAAMVANAMQRYSVEQTRLGIPLLLAEEAPHGHMAIGATVFPAGLAMAASFDTALAEQVGKAVATEVRLQGGHVSYGPVIDLCRDPRWSRVEESFGEDPFLSGEMAAAMVRGLGGGDLSDSHATIATLKHFAAYGISEGGHNGGHAQVGTYELHDCFLPPFKKAVGAGALSLMTAYNAIDGIPCTANPMLTDRLLRKEWGFRGFVVSDLYSIDGLVGTHHVAANLAGAAAMALSAGVDVDLGGNAYIRLPEAVKQGLLDKVSIDQAVRRVLTLKFEMGLFERPYVDPLIAAGVVGNDAHVNLALQAARECVVLLKNDNGILPLSDSQRVAVIGPNADNCYNQLGDYTAPQPDGRVKTVLDGIREIVGSDHVSYVKGCAVRDTSWNEIEQAVATANNADVVVAVVGGSSARDFRTSYDDTGAAGLATVSDMDCGEGFDRASLSLLGHQQHLLEALKRTGKPLVVVYIEGRPMDKRWTEAHADALLTTFYPGQEGGQALADVLFGRYNPAGRLPISVPLEAAQLPVYYNQRQHGYRNYVDLAGKPLFPFGFGLSYSDFEYSNLQVTDDSHGQITVSFDIANRSNRGGDEVPQLYIRHSVAPVAQPDRRLCRFDRIYIPAHTTRRCSFFLTKADLSVLGLDLLPVSPSAPLSLLIGPSSDQILLQYSLSP